MITQVINCKSRIKRIEKKYPDTIQQYKALLKYGEKIGMTEHQLHYYVEPYERGIEEQLVEIKDKIRLHAELERRKFWRRVLPYIFFIIVVGGVLGVMLGIIKIVVSSEKWRMYPKEQFRFWFE